jgi:hypothetical protein
MPVGSDAGDSHGAESGHADHGKFHLPPNSWIPVWVSLALTLTLIGLLPPLGPWVGVVGIVALLAGCVAWFRAARAEFRELPESIDH